MFSKNTNVDTINPNIWQSKIKEQNERKDELSTLPLFSNEASKYATKISDQANSLQTQNLSNQGIYVQTYRGIGLNLQGDPLMLPEPPKQKDMGTALNTFPGGGLNLQGTPLGLTIPGAKQIVDFPDEVIDVSNDLTILNNSPRQIDFPGNSDFEAEALTTAVNKKYIVAVPEDTKASQKTVEPQTIAAPKVTTLKVGGTPYKAAPENVPKKHTRPVPNASEEIKSFYGKKMSEKNTRLYKLLMDNEFNPQLKEYLLTCRVDDMVKKIDSMDPKILAHFNTCLERYGFTNVEDKLMALAQMQQESNFDPTRPSSSGAIGFMQMMPQTAGDMNALYKNSSDPLISWKRDLDYKNNFDNIEMGISTMAANKRYYKDKSTAPMISALSAYNAGNTATNGYLFGTPYKARDKKTNKIVIMNLEKAKTEYGIPPYDETQLYCKVIPATQDYMLRHPEKITNILKVLNNK